MQPNTIFCLSPKRLVPSQSDRGRKQLQRLQRRVRFEKLEARRMMAAAILENTALPRPDYGAELVSTQMAVSVVSAKVKGLRAASSITVPASGLCKKQ